MFDDISDDELEVQTEASDEQRDDAQEEEDQKKPGPLQVWVIIVFCISCLNVDMCMLHLLWVLSYIIKNCSFVNYFIL